MSQIVHFEYVKELSTPKYNPKLYVMLGHYCGDNQKFVPVINLEDRYNPKFKILRLNKGKVMHTIRIDAFIDNLITIENNKGQKTIWRSKTLHDFAIIMNIIEQRHRCQIIDYVTKAGIYKTKYCTELFTPENRGNSLFDFLDYISPGYFCNWHRNENFPKYIQKKLTEPRKFTWPKSEFIKY